MIKCSRCKGKQIAFSQQGNGEKKVTYQQWVTKEKSYGNEKTFKATIKDDIDISLSELCTKTKSQLKPWISKHNISPCRAEVVEREIGA